VIAAGLCRSVAGTARRPYNEEVLRFAVGLTVASGVLAAAVADYASVPGFLRKWGICMLAVAALFVTGAMLGNITRSAMCASVWVCE
jgi:hypothetical protein